MVLVVAWTNAVFHDAKADIIPAAPLNQMITEGAGFTEDLGIAEVPDLMLAVKWSLMIAVVPASVPTIATTLEMPAWRMGDKCDVATLTILEPQLDLSAS